jgi:hypothetical protein
MWLSPRTPCSFLWAFDTVKEHIDKELKEGPTAKHREPYLLIVKSKRPGSHQAHSRYLVDNWNKDGGVSTSDGSKKPKAKRRIALRTLGWYAILLGNASCL